MEVVAADMAYGHWQSEAVYLEQYVAFRYIVGGDVARVDVAYRRGENQAGSYARITLLGGDSKDTDIVLTSYPSEWWERMGAEKPSEGPSPVMVEVVEKLIQRMKALLEVAR